MKVHELIAELQKYHADREVIMSKDGEGNNFSPLADMSAGIYVPTSTWSGELTIEGPLTDEMTEEGYTDEDLYHGDDGQPCLTLWPIN